MSRVTVPLRDNDTATIKSNDRRRPLVSMFDTPAIDTTDFDYIPVWQEGHETKTVSPMAGVVKCKCGAIYCEEYADEQYEERLFQFRGSWYDLQDGFERAPDWLRERGWQYWQPESYFSAVLVKYIDGNDNDVVVGYAFW